MTRLQDQSTAHLEKLTTLSQAKSFLGREFLTWLWFRSESSDGGKLSDGTPFRFWIDDKVVLESSQSRAHVNTLRGGAPSQSIEASTALQTGKSVKELKLGLAIDGMGEYLTVLNCVDLSPRSLRLPAPNLEMDQPESLVELRLHQTRQFLDALDQLFREFLDERTGSAWEEQGLNAIRQWIKSRKQAESTILH